MDPITLGVGSAVLIASALAALIMGLKGEAISTAIQAAMGGGGGRVGATRQIMGPISGVATLTRRSAAITALNTLTVIDQTYEGTTSNFKIPAGATRIAKIAIGAVPDYGTSAVSLATLTGVRLSGEGIGGGVQEFAGPALTKADVTSGTGLASFLVEYDVNIPVQANAEPIVQGVIMGDTAPAGTYLQLTLSFA